ncbi:pheA operon leader peptide PheL [Pantoea sp. Cy-640]|nr:pheA operon leader peptide PheL [Pantoea sp. Cy-640]
MKLLPFFFAFFFNFP